MVLLSLLLNKLIFLHGRQMIKTKQPRTPCTVFKLVRDSGRQVRSSPGTRWMALYLAWQRWEMAVNRLRWRPHWTQSVQRASPVFVMCSVVRLKFPRCSDRCLSARAGRGSGSEDVISGQRSASSGCCACVSLCVWESERERNVYIHTGHSTDCYDQLLLTFEAANIKERKMSSADKNDS